ncbi:MAG: GIY-YIG nuclease family protein [Patescibacteria group bacterium]|nr:GIY-YIG nuclease family protein [Patescibacteria group bacterium]
MQAQLNFFKMWFVYMLLCDNSSFYIGITNDLVNRFQQHSNKQSFSTKEFSGIKLVYCEKYDDTHKAALREKQLKGWSKAKKQMLIDGKLGVNTCTEFAKELLNGLNL